MIVNTHINGKHLITISINYKKRGKIKRFLLNEFQRENEKPKELLLTFAGGEWYIPTELVNDFYGLIVQNYHNKIRCIH